MRIMGIDPGLTRCGIGIIDVDSTRKISLVFVDVARSDTEIATHMRIKIIADRIDELLELYNPDVVAVERVFAHDNLQSVTTTMQVMGVAMLSAARADKPMAVHTPSEVKAAVSGSGTAGKAQIQHMVQRILGMKKVLRPADAADAVAVAICHGWRGDGLQGARPDGSVNVSLSGKVRARQPLTPAQQQWASAQAAARRRGAVDPRRQQARKKKA
ncbi:MAG: crossover junction endodeoxyribonuclease RuvC [Actinomycetaceae bacterium]|nr:crossover junction endodeoxyribonuclease RuvC [Actinomycetaceae bacterium]